MNTRSQILLLLRERQFLESELNTLVYGSIEIRKNKYIYVHYREEGKLKTKYIAEYTDILYNQIVFNNLVANGLKKRIRSINTKLKKLNYVEYELSDDVKLNIDYVRRMLIDTIYKQAILEGISTTYPDTEELLNGGKINNLTSEEVYKIVNLKHAWDFILNENVITSNTDYYLLCEINKFVLESFYYTPGIIRSIPVGVGGTNWVPNIPIESDIKDNINKILNSKKSIVDKSIDLLLYTMKGQFFIDGNKRSAVIFANHYLIKNAKGMIVIPEKEINVFKDMLINYYEKNDISIKKFLKSKCYTSLKKNN